MPLITLADFQRDYTVVTTPQLRGQNLKLYDLARIRINAEMGTSRMPQGNLLPPAELTALDSWLAGGAVGGMACDTGGGMSTPGAGSCPSTEPDQDFCQIKCSGHPNSGKWDWVIDGLYAMPSVVGVTASGGMFVVLDLTYPGGARTYELGYATVTSMDPDAQAVLSHLDAQGNHLWTKFLDANHPFGSDITTVGETLFASGGASFKIDDEVIPSASENASFLISVTSAGEVEWTDVTDVFLANLRGDGQRIFATGSIPQATDIQSMLVLAFDAETRTELWRIRPRDLDFLAGEGRPLYGRPVPDGSGGLYLLAGSQNQSGKIGRLDADGNLMWTSPVNGLGGFTDEVAEQIWAMTPAQDGVFIVMRKDILNQMSTFGHRNEATIIRYDGQGSRLCTYSHEEQLPASLDARDDNLWYSNVPGYATPQGGFVMDGSFSMRPLAVNFECWRQSTAGSCDVEVGTSGDIRVAGIDGDGVFVYGTGHVNRDAVSGRNACIALPRTNYIGRLFL